MAGSNILSATRVVPARGVTAQPVQRPGIAAVAVPGEQGGKGDPAGTMTAIAAIPLSGHRAVRPGDDGRLVYASSIISGEALSVIGITTGAVEASASVGVLQSGDVTEPSWGWTPGQPVWLGPNGFLVQPRPDAGDLRSLGVAITPTRIAVALGSPLIRIV